jgi:hypothetical protein
MAQLTDKRMFTAVSSLATPDAHGPSHHEREKKPIGRRYRSLPSYAEEGIRPRISVTVLPGLLDCHMEFHAKGLMVAELDYLHYGWIKPTS